MDSFVKPFEYLYTSVDESIKNSKPIEDINAQQSKRLPEAIATVTKPTAVISQIPKEPIIPSSTVNDSKSDFKSSTDNSQKPKGKNISISVDDSVVSKDK